MAISKWISFGVAQQPSTSSATSTNLDVPLPPPATSADSKEFGLENFGNTCYANSVLQTLYFCNPFRELLLQLPDPSAPPEQTLQFAPTPSPIPSGTVRPRKPERKGSVSDSRATTEQSLPPAPLIPTTPPTLSSALRSLFIHISKNPAEKGTVAPRAFIEKLRQLNELFRSQMHQDAHEFLNYLLNRVVEEIEMERRNGADSDLSNSISSLPKSGPFTPTLVHKLFEGVLTSETRCLTCETVSSRDESFLDLSIDIEQNSSVTACLRQFSASEMLCQKNKFFCDSCCDLQEAEKRMKIKKLPNVLALHLKRFKYQEDVQKYIKLTYRVAFPMELRLFNTVDDVDDPDRLYELFSIVVHIGNGPHHGHYISIIKANGQWKVFDDDTVDTIKESDIPKYFGDSNSGSAYVLYYQAVDIDLQALGLRRPTPPTTSVSQSNSEDLPIPALPPGLENDLSSDLAESSGPTTPAGSNAAYSPKIAGEPVPLKVNIPVSELPPPMSLLTTPTPTGQKGSGGGFIHSLRHAPSARIRSAISTSMNGNGTGGVVDGALASPMSPVVPSTPTSTKGRPGTAPSSTSSTPLVSEPVPPVPAPLNLAPASPAATKVVTTNGKEKEKWFKRKSFKLEKDKDKEKNKEKSREHESDRLTASFASDASSWLRAPSSQKHTRGTESLAPPSPTSTSGSTSQRSSSPVRLTPSPEPQLPVLLNKVPKKKRSMFGPRPSTAGARISSPTTPPAPKDLPPVPTLPTTSRSPPPSPLYTTPKRRMTVTEDNSPPLENGTVTAHRKRPSSAHAGTSPKHGDFGMTQSSSSGSTSNNAHDSSGPGPVSSSFPPPAPSAPGGTGWKRATRKLSLTGTMLGFHKKDKHRDTLGPFERVPSGGPSPPPNAFPAAGPVTRR